MEDNNLLLAAVSVFVLLVVVLSKLKSYHVSTKPKLNLPPGPWALPVIGSLHHFMSSTNLQDVLHGLAQKHGPVMMFRMGEVPMMVVSSPAAAQEVFKTHDIAFAERYSNATIGALTFHGGDLTFAPYGERWRQLRKICMLELLSAARVQSFQHIREEEVSRFVGNVAASATAGAAIHLNKMVSRFVNDTILRETVGSRSKHQDEYLDALHVALGQTLWMTVADLFPSWKLMQMFDPAPRRVLAARKRIERVLKQIIKETAEAIDSGDGQQVDGILSVMLRIQKEGSAPIPLTDDVIVMVMFDMFGAGSHTSSTLLTWCMTELVRSPPTMAKVQDEVREAFKGKKSSITQDDLKGLRYLKLVIKETLRLHGPVPLLVRQYRETCKIMGYDIPKGTVVFANTWAISKDPKYWEDPEVFKPERFLEKQMINLDYQGTNFEFLPFGSGRRNCPGINLGLCNIELALASLLYHFDWKLPNGMEPKDVDIEEAKGIIASKKTNLTLHPVTRIAPASSASAHYTSAALD